MNKYLGNEKMKIRWKPMKNLYADLEIQCAVLLPFGKKTVVGLYFCDEDGV